ncbi:hypothetical protein PALA1_00307 [Pseudomonas aeruginosa]|nr:hypothetical protein PALA1_00307 [Pseudomonas aeruginosa]
MGVRVSVESAALEKIKADGRFAKLSEKWFGLDVSQPPK